MEEIMGSLRSGLSYIGALKLKEASKRATFIISNNQLNKSVESSTIGN
jgi:GMP reductase